MHCEKPFIITKNLDAKKFPDGLTVPCGKCYWCRIHKKNEWSLRVWHELEAHQDSMFVTLTYNDEHIPENDSLQKTDLQKFLKRLRKNLEGAYSPPKIRYFATGEYGDNNNRPHYHLIIFGIGLTFKKSIETSWTLDGEPLGLIHYGLVEPASIRYVASYIEKQLNGELADEVYGDREPTFKLCSQGLGRKHADKNSIQYHSNCYTSMGGNKIALPRYYVNRLKIDTEKAKQKALEIECENNEKLIGEKKSDIEIYKTLKVERVLEHSELKKSIDVQTNKNIKAKISLKKSKI